MKNPAVLPRHPKAGGPHLAVRLRNQAETLLADFSKPTPDQPVKRKLYVLLVHILMPLGVSSRTIYHILGKWLYHDDNKTLDCVVIIAFGLLGLVLIMRLLAWYIIHGTLA